MLSLNCLPAALSLPTMFDHRYDDRPPMYSPPYSATSRTFYPASSVQFPQRQYSQYSYGAPPGSFRVHERPQHFHRWFSPPGLVKTFQAATALMCFVIFACVASTLVWDVNGYAYMGYGAGATGADPGYYGGAYGYGSSYMTPQSAKAAMISATAVNFLVSLGFLVGSFSRTRVTRGCRFYFAIFVCDIILAVLQVSLSRNQQLKMSVFGPPRCRVCHGGAPSLLWFQGHHRHRLRDRGEPDVAELPERALQPRADDVPEHPEQPQPQRQPRGRVPRRVPHVQPLPVPLLLHGPRGGASFVRFRNFFPIFNGLLSRLLRRLHLSWASWWSWPSRCRRTTPTRPAARSGDTVEPTSTGTRLCRGRQRAGTHQTG